MSSRRALVLETNPVITERYIEYTNDSDWRVMLKDTLNDFLEKLQKENFDLVVAEESILPQGIIGMLRSVGVPFLLSSNTKNPEITTIPRNFNRTELLAVFNKLVPNVQKELPSEENEDEATEVNELFSDLEDEEEETFELTSDAVIEPGKPDTDEDLAGDVAVKTADEPYENDTVSDLFADLPNNGSSSEEWEDEKSVVATNPPENDAVTEEEVEETPAAETNLEPEEHDKTQERETTEGAAATESDDAVKTEITAWLEKNARKIIKEIVLEQLASLSGKQDD